MYEFSSVIQYFWSLIHQCFFLSRSFYALPNHPIMAPFENSCNNWYLFWKLRPLISAHSLNPFLPTSQPLSQYFSHGYTCQCFPPSSPTTNTTNPPFTTKPENPMNPTPHNLTHLLHKLRFLMRMGLLFDSNGQRQPHQPITTWWLSFFPIRRNLGFLRKTLLNRLLRKLGNRAPILQIKKP